MDFLDEIKDLSDKEIEKKVQETIEELEEISYEDNGEIDTIGYKLNYNPEEFNITELELSKQFPVDIRCFYSGYIRRGLRFVYGIAYDDLGLTSSDGRYYYIDDDSYILDFFKYIKNIEILNEHELFCVVLDFIKDYFKSIEDISRNEMFRMITKSGRIYYEPKSEHKFSEFKGRGNAMCSEYSLMACNILNVLGYDTYLVVGREHTEGKKGENHAFNFISYTEKETGKEKGALLDFANYVQVFDMNYNAIGISPFIGELEKLNEELVYDVVNNDKHLVFEDYSYIIIGKGAYKIGYGRNRDYYISNELTPDETINMKNKNLMV